VKQKLILILASYLGELHEVKELTVVVSLEKGPVDLNGDENNSTTLGPL
jgi:hypothetical protein